MTTQAVRIAVRGWNNGHPPPTGAGYGVRLSGHDRDEFFDREWREVIVDLNGEQGVSVSLSESFWGRSRSCGVRPSGADCSTTDLHLGRAGTSECNSDLRREQPIQPVSTLLGVIQNACTGALTPR